MPTSSGRMSSSKILFSVNIRLMKRSLILAVTAVLSALMPVDLLMQR